MSGGNWNTEASGTRGAMAGGTVAGYFANGEDARRAIHELADEGFDPRQVGAAFHSSAMGSGSKPFYERAVNDLPIHTAGGPDKSDGGPQSDTHAVSPWGLTTWGAGTPFIGSPTEPPPIPGAETPSTLPREIPSELPSQFDRPASPHDYVYSGAAFERSFSGMGIPPEHARRLARELQRGGAVVTVDAGPKQSAAEQILARNHGIIRYESAPAAGGQEPARGEEERVHVFGEVYRVYPDHVTGHSPVEDLRERKAS